MDFGKTIKDIRKNKGYTQVFTSRDIISQSSYSKFEKGESDINSVTFFKLLQRLELTTDEFFFLI